MSLQCFKVSPRPDRDATESECVKCGAQILLLKSAKDRDAQLILDERPGPYLVAEDDDGILRGFWTAGETGYAFHYDGGCAGQQAGRPELEAPRGPKYEQLRKRLER